ncbi:ADP-ribosylation factor-like protein 6-interacting protein 6 [Bombus vosnesenskii]|uniref:ADP-ribosylation factor-like protein 6-interacting protein 6 n=2 Tax=Pyrobombus TaxID=144703 RepID=A0A6J3JXW1_9HYME|nr:ADP-ribosylation factor-like protein 6-interacting protein 6 [Bombus vancouverensis nearcticus]XP_033299112.1 ADP-ribosylation factor-like protein 6-interacting protein 6 [Bombus bifarius]XP_033345111.1 ADP-ribosylation factor-like protein 6-interacting protein 6 [Bombus vosnesenskii]XP_050486930.1 ADP-ribosylation factor-like protein 6-interacting protein 6 [Bombus huntii]
MGEKNLNSRLNRTNDLVTNKNCAAPVRLWKRLQINEQNFSLVLFIVSLSIVLGKIYINYGSILQLQNNVKYVASSTSIFSNIFNVFDLSRISDISEFKVKQLTTISDKFVSGSQYDDVVNVMTSFFKTYGWLIKAAVCGLIMMGFTWFIIYKDSSIPGINPPSPFSPSKQRFSKVSGVQINYLIGILNGILIFVYMCL